MQFVKMLLLHPETDVNEEDANGDNAATYALKNNMIDCLSCILARGGLNLNHKDKQGQTLLTIAMKNQEFDIVKMLVKDEEVDLDVVDQENNSFPFLLLNSENIELFELVIQVLINNSSFKYISLSANALKLLPN